MARRQHRDLPEPALNAVAPAPLAPPGAEGEYLVNIEIGRGTAQKRVTGGRWRRIVLGGVLAGQVVELGGSPRLWLEGYNSWNPERFTDTHGQHALVGGVKRNKETNVSQSGDTTSRQGSVSASSSGPGYGQWPGIRRPGTL